MDKPFNGVKSYVSYKDTRFIVFWSKNPKPLLRYLPILKQRGIGCYIQYSLNDYEEEGLEKNVPPSKTTYRNVQRTYQYSWQDDYFNKNTKTNEDN